MQVFTTDKRTANNQHTCMQSIITMANPLVYGNRCCI